jgi:hypothetical protein
MTTLAVLLGAVSLVSIATLWMILYEYRRVLRKRAVLWSAIAHESSEPRANAFLLALYALGTFALAGLSLYIILFPA